MTQLPKYWESMDVGTLWDALNRPDRFLDAPNPTYDALVWSLVHNNGWARGRRGANKRRIGELSPRQFHQLIDTLKRNNCDPALIAEIESYL